MSSMRKSRQTSHCKSLTVKTIFGAPPILPEEDLEAYDELLARVSDHVKPTNIIEEIWVRDVIDLTWEILRWRKIKVSLVSGAIPDVLSGFLRPFVAELPVYAQAEKEAGATSGALAQEVSKEIVRLWEMKGRDGVPWVDELIANKSISMDAVVNSAFIQELHRIEQIDRLITVAESRRNAVLREIGRHRATLAQLLREKVQDVQDAEFETIEPKSIPQYNRANEKAA